MQCCTHCRNDSEGQQEPASAVLFCCSKTSRNDNKSIHGHITDVGLPGQIPLWHPGNGNVAACLGSQLYVVALNTGRIGPPYVVPSD